MTTTILIIINVFAALSIIVLALMQQSKGDMGSAFGGGGSQSMFGSRGSANFLSRLTAMMCAAFFISSLALAYVYAQRAESTSVVDSQSSLTSPVVESELPTIEGEAVETDASGDIPAIEGAIESETPVVSETNN
jgi:preprotein translocase subunit SecG